MATDRPIYLDHAGTTPVDPRVLDVMLPYLRDVFGNAASRSHAYGWEAEAAVDRARQQAADVIGASPKEIVWTSGATESNNIAVKGGARMYAKKGPGESGRGHVITAATEHKAVIDPARRLEKEGFDVTFLKPGPDGVITAAMVEDALRDDTILVSLMWANNEIGTINEIPEIGRLCRGRDIIFHTDATQWVGKMPVDVNADNIDVLSWSGHKIYGPKGVGALYVRRKNPRVRLEPIFDGGGHERGIRSGTINVPGVVGFGAACELCQQEMEQDRTRLLALRNTLENGLNEKLEAVYINGHPERRLPHLSNISFGFVEGESLMMGANEIACSSGSACTSASLEPSYVLKALGVNDELAHSSLRLSMGRWTTKEEIDRTIDVLVKAVTHLRELSPLWDLYKEGVDLSTIEWQSH